MKDMSNICELLRKSSLNHILNKNLEPLKDSIVSFDVKMMKMKKISNMESWPQHFGKLSGN